MIPITRWYTNWYYRKTLEVIPKDIIKAFRYKIAGIEVIPKGIAKAFWYKIAGIEVIPKGIAKFSGIKQPANILCQ